MNTYLLRTATLVAAFGSGAGSTLLLQDATAHAAITQEYTDREEWQMGAAASTTLTNFVTSQVCGRFNTKHGLSGADVCSSGDINELFFQQRAPGVWHTIAKFKRQSTVVLSAPQ